MRNNPRRPVRVTIAEAATRPDVSASRLSPASGVALLYMLTVVVNLSFGFLEGFRAAPGRLEADEYEYYLLMQQVLSGTVEIGGRRTLGFPIVLAAIHSISSSFLFLQIGTCLLYSFAPPLLFLLARRLSGSLQVGFAAGLALALWPPAIYFGTSLYSETLALPVFLLSLRLLPLGGDEGPRQWLFNTLMAGIVLGLTTHVRPMYLIALPFLWVAILIEDWKLRPALLRVLALTAGFLIVILPWSFVVSSRYHQPILVTSNGGETLGGGLNRKLLEMSAPVQFDTPERRTWVGPGKWLAIYENGYLTPAELKRPYQEIDRLLRRRTIEWALANPQDALYLEFRKIAYMWGLYPLFVNGTPQVIFGNIPTICLLAGGIGFFVACRADRRRLARLWILPVFVSAVALISWGSWRFRQPGDAGLLAFCVICAAQVLLNHRRRSPPKS